MSRYRNSLRAAVPARRAPEERSLDPAFWNPGAREARGTAAATLLTRERERRELRPRPARTYGGARR